MTQTHQVDNAIIMAAGFSSRFAPYSDICPKALLPVKGEILIERLIGQLKSAGIPKIYIVVGYKKEMFRYLESKTGAILIENPEYQTRNNNSTLYAVRHLLANSYICCSDNYFTENVFRSQENRPYYSALYAQGPTEEYCLQTDSQQRITRVTVGGTNSWYMFGHVYFDRSFSQTYTALLEQDYNLPHIPQSYWEQIYMDHIDTLTLYKKEYSPEIIQEFDSLQDLAKFDPYYQTHTQEEILTHLTTLHPQ